jgi:KDO2-lipid IV(A) lauroyltransferase
MKTTLLRSFIRFLGILPLPLLRALGRVGGWLLYQLPNRERENARVNLTLCFPGMAPQEREQLLKEALKETAITLLEMPAVWYGSTDTWLARLEPGRVPEEIRRLQAQGRGLIVAMPHLGNFEISAHFFGSLGPATGLYRPPRKAGLEPLMLEGRNRPGHNRMVATDRAGIKALYAALSRGEIIVILPDQRPKSRQGGAGVFAPFFGVPALTMTLVNRFARKTGAPVYFIGFVRQRGSRKYQVIGHPGDAAIADEDPLVAATALNAGVEALVRQYPEQYQWTYRRFREQPDGGNPYRLAKH